MAKRSGGEGNSGALVLGSKSSFFWGVVAGVALCIAVCTLWCGHGGGCGMGKCCAHDGASGCAHGDKAAEGKTGTSK